MTNIYNKITYTKYIYKSRMFTQDIYKTFTMKEYIVPQVWLTLWSWESPLYKEENNVVFHLSIARRFVSSIGCDEVISGYLFFK